MIVATSLYMQVTFVFRQLKVRGKTPRCWSVSIGLFSNMKMYLRTYAVQVLIDLLQNLLTWVTYFFLQCSLPSCPNKKPKEQLFMREKIEMP